MHLYTVDEMAKELHMSVGTVRNRLSQGEPMPPSVKVGRRRLFPEESFKNWMKLRLESNDSRAVGE